MGSSSSKNNPDVTDEVDAGPLGDQILEDSSISHYILFYILNKDTKQNLIEYVQSIKKFDVSFTITHILIDRGETNENLTQYLDQSTGYMYEIISIDDTYYHIFHRSVFLGVEEKTMLFLRGQDNDNEMKIKICMQKYHEDIESNAPIFLNLNFDTPGVIEDTKIDYLNYTNVKDVKVYEKQQLLPLYSIKSVPQLLSENTDVKHVSLRQCIVFLTTKTVSTAIKVTVAAKNFMGINGSDTCIVLVFTAMISNGLKKYITWIGNVLNIQISFATVGGANCIIYNGNYTENSISNIDKLNGIEVYVNTKNAPTANITTSNFVLDIEDMARVYENLYPVFTSFNTKNMRSLFTDNITYQLDPVVNNRDYVMVLGSMVIDKNIYHLTHIINSWNEITNDNKIDLTIVFKFQTEVELKNSMNKINNLVNSNIVAKTRFMNTDESNFSRSGKGTVEMYNVGSYLYMSTTTRNYKDFLFRNFINVLIDHNANTNLKAFHIQPSSAINLFPCKMVQADTFPSIVDLRDETSLKNIETLYINQYINPFISYEKDNGVNAENHTIMFKNNCNQYVVGNFILYLLETTNGYVIHPNNYQERYTFIGHKGKLSNEEYKNILKYIPKLPIAIKIQEIGDFLLVHSTKTAINFIDQEVKSLSIKPNGFDSDFVIDFYESLENVNETPNNVAVSLTQGKVDNPEMINIGNNSCLLNFTGDTGYYSELFDGESMAFWKSKDKISVELNSEYYTKYISSNNSVVLSYCRKMALNVVNFIDKNYANMFVNFPSSIINVYQIKNVKTPTIFTSGKTLMIGNTEYVLFSTCKNMVAEIYKETSIKITIPVPRGLGGNDDTFWYYYITDDLFTIQDDELTPDIRCIFTIEKYVPNINDKDKWNHVNELDYVYFVPDSDIIISEEDVFNLKTPTIAYIDSGTKYIKEIPPSYSKTIDDMDENVINVCHVNVLSTDQSNYTMFRTLRRMFLESKQINYGGLINTSLYGSAKKYRIRHLNKTYRYMFEQAKSTTLEKGYIFDPLEQIEFDDAETNLSIIFLSPVYTFIGNIYNMHNLNKFLQVKWTPPNGSSLSVFDAKHNIYLDQKGIDNFKSIVYEGDSMIYTHPLDVVIPKKFNNGIYNICIVPDLKRRNAIIEEKYDNEQVFLDKPLIRVIDVEEKMTIKEVLKKITNLFSEDMILDIIKTNSNDQELPKDVRLVRTNPYTITLFRRVKDDGTEFLSKNEIIGDNAFYKLETVNNITNILFKPSHIAMKFDNYKKEYIFQSINRSVNNSVELDKIMFKDSFKDDAIRVAIYKDFDLNYPPNFSQFLIKTSSGLILKNNQEQYKKGIVVSIFKTEFNGIYLFNSGVDIETEINYVRIEDVKIVK